MSGRPRLPTAQKKVQGTNRKHRENKNEPKYEALCATIAPPDYLNSWSKDMWISLLKEKQGIIETVDIFAFEMLCLTFGSWKDCAIQINKNPCLLENESHGGMSTIAQTMFKSFTACEKMMSRFGLTPADRSRLGLIKEKDKDEDTKKMEELSA